MKLKIFTSHQLQSLIDEATVGQTEEQWHREFLKGVAAIIKNRPIAYRSFGPFWWPVKKYLQEADLLDGEPVDPVQFDEVTMGSKTLDLAAAFAYQDWTNSSMTATGNVWNVETDEGEMIEYPVIDEELEVMHGTKFS